MAFVDLKSGSKKKCKEYDNKLLSIVHNTSEKRRVERLNSKIDELYTILTVSYYFISYIFLVYWTSY